MEMPKNERLELLSDFENTVTKHVRKRMNRAANYYIRLAYRLEDYKNWYYRLAKFAWNADSALKEELENRMKRIFAMGLKELSSTFQECANVMQKDEGP